MIVSREGIKGKTMMKTALKELFKIELGGH
jgi:hypothetical protein